MTCGRGVPNRLTENQWSAITRNSIVFHGTMKNWREFGISDCEIEPSAVECVSIAAVRFATDHALHLTLGADMMSTTTHFHAHAVLNRDRDEVRVPSPLGEPLLAFLARRGLRGNLRTDRAGDVITLDGEPDMGRVRSVLDDWERSGNTTSA